MFVILGEYRLTKLGKSQLLIVYIAKLCVEDNLDRIEKNQILCDRNS